ncbi:MAG: iron-siderophore ABC transporter substrate-binding protein [Leptolyngbyaceae cyanobacterium RM1_406_9]|nr:iron-siderophore ABC transporter substrate-binding protein [Leptolyngbyaceae cyanobacterium RM1_406_9]
MSDRASISRKITQRVQQFLWAVLAFLFVSACGAVPSQVNTAESPNEIQAPVSTDVRVVKHLMGETQVPSHPQRVITLDTSYLANALALGIQPIGSTVWLRQAQQTGLGSVEPYLKDSSQELTILGYGSNAEQVSLEKILTLKPDLILADQDHQAIYSQLSQIAPTVLYPDPYANDDVRDGWKSFLRSTAEVLGKSQEAETLLNEYDQRIQEFKQRMGNRLSSVQISVINPMPEGVRLIYQDTFAGRVIQDAGLSRPTGQDKDGYSSNPLSLELIPQMDGDVVFVISFMDAENLKLIEQLKNHPLWSQLEAVKQDKVYPVDAEHWYGSDIVTADLILDDLFKYLLEEE